MDQVTGGVDITPSLDDLTDYQKKKVADAKIIEVNDTTGAATIEFTVEEDTLGGYGKR